jgi:hypothetical protein
MSPLDPTVARLTASSLLGRRRALLLLALPAVLLALAGGARLFAGQDTELSSFLLGSFALGTVVPLLGLLAGTGAIGPEIDDGSIVYLLSKPLSRHVVVLTKLLVAVMIVLALGALPTLVAGLVVVGTADGLAVGFAVGAAAAGVGYCALCWAPTPPSAGSGWSCSWRSSSAPRGTPGGGCGPCASPATRRRAAHAGPGARPVQSRRRALSATAACAASPSSRWGAPERRTAGVHDEASTDRPRAVRVRMPLLSVSSRREPVKTKFPSP